MNENEHLAKYKRALAGIEKAVKAVEKAVDRAEEVRAAAMLADHDSPVGWGPRPAAVAAKIAQKLTVAKMFPAPKAINRYNGWGPAQ